MSTLSAGLQNLANAGLLPSSLSADQLNKASSQDINKLARANAASLFYGSSSSSDAVSSSLSSLLSAGSSNSTKTNPLQTIFKLAFAQYAAKSSPSSSSTSNSTQTSASTSTKTGQTGTLFSLLG
jgi:hypothetical protein